MSTKHGVNRFNISSNGGIYFENIKYFKNHGNIKYSVQYSIIQAEYSGAVLTQQANKTKLMYYLRDFGRNVGFLNQAIDFVRDEFKTTPKMKES